MATNFTFPDFQKSIVNLSATMEQFLGKKTQHATLPTLSAKLDPQIKNIVYLVIDGMGARILEKNLPAQSFLRRHQIQTITSVFPSTTAAATTALISARTSSEHGWFAWALDFDGTVVELFRNRNYYTKEFLSDPNFINDNLPYEHIWENHKSSRAIYTCFPKIARKSSTEHEIEYQTFGQMVRKLHKTCRQPNDKFIYAYFPDLDSTMHAYGTQHRKARHLLKKIDRKLARLVRRTPNTLFVITADHGQIDTQGNVFICDDQAIQDCLAHPIAWDSRVVSFKIKKGFDDKFKQAFAKYSTDFALFTPETLIQQGLFGATKMKPQFRKLMGDYIAIGTETGKRFVTKKLTPKKIKKLDRGIHSGMTPDEMFVPVIVARGE